MQNGVSAAINCGSVTAADYAVLVSNVGGVAHTKDVLVDFASHYGEVLAAFPLLAVGDVLTQCDAVRSLSLSQCDAFRAPWLTQRATTCSLRAHTKRCPAVVSNAAFCHFSVKV